MANAGGDIIVWVNETELNGSYTDRENNIKDISWTKVSGPDSFKLENKSALHTKLTGLVKGIYQFELTVSDHFGLYDKDTVIVTVGDISAITKEIILKDLTWIFPWYNNVEIQNFFSYVPRGNPFKIFIQRDYDSSWKEVPASIPYPYQTIEKYDYFIITDVHDFYNKGSLYISYYGSDVNASPNVKYCLLKKLSLNH